MSNFNNPSVIAAEALDQLDYELVAGSLMYRDRTEDFSSVRGLKVGDTVSIRTVTDLATTEFTGTGPVTAQEIQQSSTNLVIEKHFDVTVKITAKEKALNLDGIRKEIVNPAMTSLAQKVDTYLLGKITEAQGLYASNTLGASAADIALARKSANIQQIAKGNRIALVDDDLEATLLGQDAFTKFDTRGEAGATALQEADLGRLLGFNWFSSVNMPGTARTAGDGTTTLDSALTTTNLQGLSTLTVDSTSGTFEAGDKIQIAGAKRAFTVATQVVATGVAIPIVEQINENLSSNSGLDGAAITVIGSGQAQTYQGVVFEEGAFGFAAPPLDAEESQLSGVASANGMSIRLVEWYDGVTKQTYWSFDMLIGAKAVDPRKAMLLADY